MYTFYSCIKTGSNVCSKVQSRKTMLLYEWVRLSLYNPWSRICKYVRPWVIWLYADNVIQIFCCFIVSYRKISYLTHCWHSAYYRVFSACRVLIKFTGATTLFLNRLKGQQSSCVS